MDDVPMLDEDIQRIRDLFCAEGEGLPDDRVAAACLRLTELLAVMQLETYDLIRNLEQVTTKCDVSDSTLAPACNVYTVISG